MAHSVPYEQLLSEINTPSEWIKTDSSLEEIEPWLLKQPQSYEMYFTKDQMLARIGRGELIPWMYMRHEEPQGLILLRVPVTPNLRILEIAFLSCEKPFAMASALRFLDNFATTNGYEAIVAVAENRIAKAAVRRHDFSDTHTVIFKRLRKEM